MKNFPYLQYCKRNSFKGSKYSELRFQWFILRKSRFLSFILFFSVSVVPTNVSR